MNIDKELAEIGRLMMSASVIIGIRKEVDAVLKEGFVVTDGNHCRNSNGCEVVVRCAQDRILDVTRRIRAKFPDMETEKIAEGVLGIRTARRGSING